MRRPIVRRGVRGGTLARVEERRSISDRTSREGMFDEKKGPVFGRFFPSYGTRDSIVCDVSIRSRM